MKEERRPHDFNAERRTQPRDRLRLWRLLLDSEGLHLLNGDGGCAGSEDLSVDRLAFASGIVV
jgi:hypothetical protein